MTILTQRCVVAAVIVYTANIWTNYTLKNKSYATTDDDALLPEIILSKCNPNHY